MAAGAVVSRSTYEDGSLCVVVDTGPQAQDAVQIGVGLTWREAIEDLESTPVQSVGRDGGSSTAIHWALHSGWLTGPLTEVEVDLEDLDAP